MRDSLFHGNQPEVCKTNYLEISQSLLQVSAEDRLVPHLLQVFPRKKKKKLVPSISGMVETYRVINFTQNQVSSEKVSGISFYFVFVIQKSR